MKKLLVILLFFFTVPLMAQQLWWVDTTSTGTEKKVYLGNFDTEITSGGLRFAKLPVKLDSTMIVRIDSLIADMATSKGYLLYIKENTDSLVVDVATIKGYLAVSLGYDHPANAYYAKRDTIATTAVDTIDVSTSTVWHSLSVFAVDDELQVSVDGTNWVIVPTYTTLTLSKLSSVTFTEFYVKQRDGSGNVIYDVAWIGY